MVKNMHQTDLPLISVGLAFYNVEKTIANAVKSVLMQTYHNFEFIIIDDGSTAILNNYFAESFLHKVDYHPKLGRSLFKVDKVINNALLCPEATLKSSLYNNLFNSSSSLSSISRSKS